MRRTIWLAALAVMLVLAGTSNAQTKANPGLERMKSLAGTWQGIRPEGGKFTVVFRVVSNGTAIEESLNGMEEADMVTLYTSDGDRVMVTHFCSAGNQPRMETGAVTGTEKEYDFSFVGASNLASPSAGHMHHLNVKFDDNDHVTET
ncbi:MAG: hypothetical protein WBP79_13790 [Candidatus Acidiferrales bacterium]